MTELSACKILPSIQLLLLSLSLLLNVVRTPFDICIAIHLFRELFEKEEKAADIYRLK